MGVNSIFLNKMHRFFLFYILIQTASGAIEYGYEIDLDDAPDFNNERIPKHKKYNDILSNLHGVYKRRSHDSAGNVNADDIDNSMTLLKDHDKVLFDKVIADVTRALDKVKEELIKFNNEGVITVEVPNEEKGKRYKRDLSTESNDTLTEVLQIEDNVTEVSEITTESPEIVTEKVETTTATVETTAKPVARTNNDTDDSVNSRRMIPAYVPTNSRVKDKLISYLEDTFNEVEKKIKPLTNIKIALSNDDHYRIGYIIATIDTLEVNLRKLKTDMNLHQQSWGDEKILDLFDRIKATNSVTTTLIETLKRYLPKHT